MYVLKGIARSIYTTFVSHSFRQIACYISCSLLNVNTRRFTKSSPTSVRMWSSPGRRRRGGGGKEGEGAPGSGKRG